MELRASKGTSVEQKFEVKVLVLLGVSHCMRYGLKMCL